MKKVIAIVFFCAIALASFAQQTFVQLVRDTVNQKYRFQRIEIRQYETVSDTLVTDRFPEKWLTASELKAYQEALIGGFNERFAELSRLRKLAKDEMDIHISYYEQLQGAGAWIALQKTRLQASLQGDWKLVERSANITKADVTINVLELRKNQNKFGTLTINDDMSITLSGYYNFNLTFAMNNQAEWHAERNGVIYTLKK